jgi:hypothetical protein
MDTFIVRFYRCARCSPQDIAGVVEHVDSGKRSGFSGQKQLLDRLLKPRNDSAPHGQQCSIRHAATRAEKSITNPTSGDYK